VNQPADPPANIYSTSDCQVSGVSVRCLTYLTGESVSCQTKPSDSLCGTFSRMYLECVRYLVRRSLPIQKIADTKMNILLFELCFS